MYNRYIPQQDGSYRKNRMPEPPQKREPSIQDPPASPPASCQGQSAESFLRQLLPKIIILLLLMAGDCDDEKNSVLLTLALYMFL